MVNRRGFLGVLAGAFAAKTANPLRELQANGVCSTAAYQQQFALSLDEFIDEYGTSYTLAGYIRPTIEQAFRKMDENIAGMVVS